MLMDEKGTDFYFVSRSSHLFNAKLLLFDNNNNKKEHNKVFYSPLMGEKPIFATHTPNLALLLGMGTKSPCTADPSEECGIMQMMP